MGKMIKWIILCGILWSSMSDISSCFAGQCISKNKKKARGSSIIKVDKNRVVLHSEEENQEMELIEDNSLQVQTHRESFERKLQEETVKRELAERKVKELEEKLNNTREEKNTANRPSEDRENGMEIFLTTLQGNTVTLFVYPNQSIDSLFEEIDKKFGYSPRTCYGYNRFTNEPRIIFAGKELEKGKLLSDYPIRKESTLHWVCSITEEKPVILPAQGYSKPQDKVDGKSINQKENKVEGLDILIVIPSSINDSSCYSGDPSYSGEYYKVGKFDKIDCLLTEIANKLHRPRDTIKLINKKQELDPSKTFADYNMENGEMIHVMLKSDNSLRVSGIWVKTITGRMNVYHLCDSDKIEYLMSQICSKEGIPQCQQRLIYSGRQLESDRFIGDYRIQNHKYIELRLTQRGGKPVILLYPPTKTNCKVHLDLCNKWNLSEIHPVVNHSKTQVNWDVQAHPTTLFHHGKEYSYLFWEADTVAPLFSCEPNKAFCLKADPKKISDFLDEALQRRGLNARERQDLITYWLPEMHKKPYICIQFREEEYTEAAKLTITPTPERIIRVFMTFWGADEYVEECLKEDTYPQIERPADKFVAVEWGGMNMDKSYYSEFMIA